MKYISLFSGVEAATVAWEGLGWDAVAFSEIDDFPSAVLKERFPNVPNLGDITKVDWSTYAGAVDVIVGGSPCQSFSIAGTRTGLQGESGLMFEYIRAVREVMPRYFVWENVPGALSSEHGAAFGQLLSEMDELGYGMAWRVLDAQHFGVPQRRRRVFLIGCFGNQYKPAKILFERESMCWDFAKGKDARKRIAERLKDSVGSSYKRERVTCLQGNMIGRDDKNGPQGCGYQNDVSYTLNCIDRHAIVSQEVYENHAQDSRVNGPLEVSPTVVTQFGTGGNNLPIVLSKPHYQVRRLTPVECERLQGFPDGWTDIEFKGKPAPDSKRYKAMGNSMAVPVMRWIGERIQMFD